MFGYVTAEKSQLTKEEYEIFCQYYCGVCRAIGRQASQWARFGLSYDITFLAVVLSSVCSDSSEKCRKRCIAHPVKSRAFVADDSSINYAAAMGVILEYLKLADDWHDERSIKALFGMAILYRGYRRVGKVYTDQLQFIKSQLGALSQLEKNGCKSLDETADVFAKILESLFTPDFIKSDSMRRALAWLGYNLGRWIYIIDAYNDMDQDIKSGSYNPLVAAGETDRSQCAESINLGMTVTLENIASAYELIGFKCNRDIIGKMIYIGLKEKQISILFDIEFDNDKKKVD